MKDRRNLLIGGAKAIGVLGTVGLTSAFRLEAIPKAYIQGHVVSDDPSWELLSNLELLPSIERGVDQARFSEAIRRLSGKQFTIRGFMLQLTADPYFTHFVVTRRNSSCAFCPPNGPGEAVEIFGPRRMAYSAFEYSITGTLQLFNNPSTGLYYRLINSVSTRL